MGTEIDVLCASHGNETLGIAVHEAIEANPRPGLRSRIAHPKAAALGERLLGVTQIMGHYPGDLSSTDPEDVAAAENMEWLGDHVGSEAAIVHDIHNSDIPGNFFCEVGDRALKATLGSAFLLGHRRIVTRTDPFYSSVPNAVAFEIPILSEAEERTAATKLYRDLTKVAELGIDRLHERYERAKSGLTFWHRREVVIGPTDYPDSVVVDDPELLKRLEAIPIRPAMTELVLDDDLRQALRIEGDRRILVEYWGYRNMSHDLPDRGLFDGRPRKLAFGAFLEEAEPPVDDENWVEFKKA